MTMKTTAKTRFEKGKVYCIDLPDLSNINYKRLLRYQGQDIPWEDICSGEKTSIDPQCISEATEVPQSIIEAIKLSQDKNSFPQDLPHNVYIEKEPADSWERDIYCDDWES